MKIGIIDYGMGNTGSVTAALRRLGVEPLLTARSTCLMAAPP